MSAREAAREIEFGTVGDFPYAIWRNSMGALCGYIAVPSSHPWYGMDYDDVGADVHGGLTFGQHERRTRRFNRERLQYLIEHEGDAFDSEEFESIPKFVETPAEEPYPHDTGMDVWWFGFDCGHYGDYVPGLGIGGGVYRDRDYVYREIERLAQQAGEAVAVSA